MKRSTASQLSDAFRSSGLGVPTYVARRVLAPAVHENMYLFLFDESPMITGIVYRQEQIAGVKLHELGISPPGTTENAFRLLLGVLLKEGVSDVTLKAKIGSRVRGAAERVGFEPVGNDQKMELMYLPLAR